MRMAGWMAGMYGMYGWLAGMDWTYMAIFGWPGSDDVIKLVCPSA